MAESRGENSDEPHRRRLIFSRKGFDSGYGGKPSPILPNGVMVSLPIPETDSALRYSECQTLSGENYRELLLRLGIERIRNPSGTGDDRSLDVRNDPGVHLDPDLSATARPRADGWRPLFGQVGASQTHLSRNGVGPGDLFLFFGWFCPVDENGARLKYRPRREHTQSLFGWLEIGDVIDVRHDAVPPWASDHPHVREQHHPRFRLHNTLYVAAKTSTFVPGAAGGGVFSWNPRLQLTKPGETPSIWQLPRVFHPDATFPALLTHHTRDAWTHDGELATLRSARIGQEFVIPMTPSIEEWARGIVALGA